jgi:transglutaminase-like putative cysteine protease
MWLSVWHLTHYHYQGPVLSSYNDARLCPISDPLQRCDSFRLTLKPDVPTRVHHDFYQNRVDHFEIHEPHEELEVLAESVVETRLDPRGLPPVGLAVSALEDPSIDENYFDFVSDSDFVSLSVDLWREAVDVAGGQAQDLWEDAVKIGRHLFGSFEYDTDSTHVHTNASEALSERRGVCQDFAHVMLGMCRSIGIPARYVSGYFFNGKTGDEVEASHAWVEVFLPHFGWKGFDPTHDRPSDSRYVKLAVGRDYKDIKPISGTMRGKGTERLEVDVRIRELTPPVTGSPD